jgi:serine/threonine protein kinase
VTIADQSIGRQRRVSFVEALGRGGFGAVYLVDVRGRDGFVQRVAVKVLNENLKDEADIVARQRDEARLLAQLNHDHIVKVYDLTEIHGRPAVFMEYIPGVDAGRLLRCGPLPPRAALEVAAATASAIHAAWWSISPVTGRPLHAVHRDIKPSNILVSEHGMVKVLDFGIARADFDREGETKSHQFGTARYMAPEQWLGLEAGPGVDVFALGVSLVELLTGEWQERIPMMADRFPRLRDAMVASVQDSRWGGVWWRELQTLLTRMLAFEAVLRPSADEVESALIDLADGIGGEGLRRFARREVPILMIKQRERTQELPLLSDTQMWLTSDIEPSIVTQSKLEMQSARKAAPARRPMRSIGLLVSGLMIGLVWVGTGLLPDAIQTDPEMSAPSPQDEPLVSTDPEIPTDEASDPPTVPAIGMVIGGEGRPVERALVVEPALSAERSGEGSGVLSIGLESRPSGAQVFIDGRLVGATPMAAMGLSLGVHRLEMRKNGHTASRRISVRDGSPTRFIWILEDNDWASGY